MNDLENKEIFSLSISVISNIEEEDDASINGFSEIINAIDPIKKPEKGEKEEELIEQGYLNIELNKENANKTTTCANQQIILKSVITSAETKHKDPEKMATKEFLISIKNMLNKIIRLLGNKQRLSSSKINRILEAKSLEEIKHKTLKEIFILLSPKNSRIISCINNIEKEKGKTAFTELIKLTFEEMYDYYIQDCKCVVCGMHINNLTGKFKILKDVSKTKVKKLRKNKFKKIEKKKFSKVEERPKEIIQEVCAVLID